MLKQLELVGFKSFAERTVFTFGSGMTAIVGPNGSGKSNVVDAVRWIMGEQSAKSLRGGGMTDVIFNGSTTRKSLGLAEVSLTLDNGKRFLTLDADEVQITRRVYRDGTGEYLINRQVARLKDIKEMFLGSGAGVDAYCIIAQGRVESLLQASSQERRFILEEAAGISRFRVKKLETLRKLEQVEQNLQRVRDIQDELNRQLQAVRLQAAKAERFREYSEQLKQLRVSLALQEWDQETKQLTAAMDDAAALKNALTERSTAATEQEKQLACSEALLSEAEDAVRRSEAAIAQCREKLVALDSQATHEAATILELELSLKQGAQRLEILSSQAKKINETLAGLNQEHESQELERVQYLQKMTDADAQLSATSQELAAIRQQLQSGKQSLYERMQESARAHNDLVSVRTQLDSLRSHRRRLDEKHSQTQGSISALDVELKALEATKRDAHERVEKLRETLSGIRHRKESVAVNLESLSLALSAQRERLSGLTSRVQILQTLEQNREGVGAGPRKILEHVAQTDSVLRNNVLGMVADLILVDRDHASIIDTALGDQVQSIVVTHWETVRLLLRDIGEQLPGRVCFLPISQGHTAQAMESANSLTSLTQFIGAIKPELARLPEQLLGTTFLVGSLEEAQQHALLHPGKRFVTRAGEMVDAGGFISVGPERQDHGFLSRKSELRELNERATELEAVSLECEQEITNLRSALAQLVAQEEQTEQAIQVLGEEIAALRTRLQQHRLTGQNLVEEARERQSEIVELDQEIHRLAESQTNLENVASSAEALAQRMQLDLQAAESAQVTLESQRQKEQEVVVAAKLDFARTEQQATLLRQRLEALSFDRQEKSNELEMLQRQQTDLQLKHSACQASLQSARLELEILKEAKAAAEIHLEVQAKAATEHRQHHAQLREQSHLIRQEWQQLVDQVHAREMQVSELRLRRESLAARLFEEHEIDLAAAYDGYQSPEKKLDISTSQAQIQELRRKISRLGNVSLDSLQELAALEGRSSDLQAQETDLRQAKGSLDEIIERINSDSKQLFQETYDSVRVHFQELFRKLFGGGMADIVLENPQDLLETGVDIVARPPGKEMRNMSLLSGGEKTMTAVALLLAIFKNKPSPFCILDEVDAALDEANVGRFASVLREFLHLSQFILITHSKKTMAAADVLYGVTMQEAGVSKRIAVRLEDYQEPVKRLAA